MTTNSTFKIFTDKMGGTRANTYIGTIGEVFYDVDGTTPLRLSNGTTPGGIPFGISSISSSFDPQFKTVSGNTLSGTVSTGSYVKQGQVIGYIGTSGLATGPHVHYEFRINNKFYNPMTVRLPNAAPVPRKELKRYIAWADNEIEALNSSHASKVGATKKLTVPSGEKNRTADRNQTQH